MEAFNVILVILLILIAIIRFFFKEIKKQAEREAKNRELAIQMEKQMADQMEAQKEGGSFFNPKNTETIFYEQQAEEVTGDRINHPLTDFSTEDEKKKMLLYKEIFEPVYKKY